MYRQTWWNFGYESLKSGSSDRFYFLGLQNHCWWWWLKNEIKRCLLLGRKTMTNLAIILKSRGITLPIKVHIIKAMVFPVVIYRCESWTIKKAEHWRIDVSNDCAVEDSWDSLDCKETKPVNPERNQIRLFIGKTDAEVEAAMLWPPDAKSRLIEDPDAGKDWRQKEKMAEDEMVR